ncbi:MAG: M20 family peptidase [Desulfobacteraceae bacterium]|nr:MAG: M20 family peptidase [Desulfobacteraceae bacterium]
MEDLLKYVDVDGAVGLCQELVRIPSPIGSEKAVAEFLADTMKRIGLKGIELVEGEKGRPNVVGKIPGSGGGRSLNFYGHMDSEYVGEKSFWKVAPYGGEIIDGKLYGRASKDMRAGIAAFLKTAEAIIRSGVKLKGDLQLSFCVDEETAGDKGLGYLVENGYVRTEASVQSETYSFGDIMVADAGFLWLEIKTEGASVHCQLESERKRGINAVEKMAKIILALKDLRLEYREHPLFQGMKPVVTPGTTIASRVGEHPNVVPEVCTATFDVRLVPGQKADDALAAIAGVIERVRAEDGEVHAKIREIGRRESTEIPLDDPIIQVAARNFEKVTGKKAKVVGHEMTSDNFWLRRAGIRAIHFGPGNLTAHKPNEYIDVLEIKQATKIYTLMALEYIGVEG